jgi:hypothetical protein
MRKIMMSLSAVLLVLGIIGPVQADLINFESGFTDMQAVSQVITATNAVSFWVGQDQRPAYIARVGLHTTAFVPRDRPMDISVSGRYFLTDERNGPWARLPYFMSFVAPVQNLSLNLYDYRALDGGPHIGDSVTLSVFDQAHHLVGTASYTITSPNPINGNILLLSVMNPTGLIYSASLTFSGTGDVGTGIDNIRFITASAVPVPASLLLLGSGLLGLAGWWRFRKG